MANSTVSQIFQNTVANAQSGDDVVAQATIECGGGDILFGFSGSAWSQAGGAPIGLTVWLDNEPLGGGLSIYANSGGMHMSLGRSWVHAPGVSPGQHKLMVVASPGTITDQNDRVNLTQLELNDGLALCTTTDVPCPAGTGQVLSTQRFEMQGGSFLLSSAGSGWVAQANQLVGLYMLFDGGDGSPNQVFANNANQHLAAVPYDSWNASGGRGDWELQLTAASNTSTDQGDIAHLSAIEWIDPTQAPVVVDMNPWTMGTSASQQQGGGYILSAGFGCTGGPLLFRTSISGWCPNQDTMIGASIEIDGNPVGNIELFANPATTHLAMPSNDLVVTGIPAGQHSFQLQAGASTYTDQNDLVSVLPLEFPQ
jgi:hypothetical protein